jgi:hypothetical protein
MNLDLFNLILYKLFWEEIFTTLVKSVRAVVESCKILMAFSLYTVYSSLFESLFTLKADFFFPV